MGCVCEAEMEPTLVMGILFCLSVLGIVKDDLDII